MAISAEPSRAPDIGPDVNHCSAAHAVTLEAIQLARKRINTSVRRTPLIESNSLGRQLGCSLFLKAEMLQRTGSFKLRGASNKLAVLPPLQRERGVIAASAGNHAQGVAVAARVAGVHAVVVMPESAPHAKVNASRGYGAEVILRGAHYQDATEYAARLAGERGLTLIHAFDDADVIAGQGTIGLEILEDLPEFDAIVIPVGGGGLIAGIAAALRALRPKVRIIGVQAANAPAVARSFSSGVLETVVSADTIADGIAVERPGEIPFQLIRRFVDDIVTVEESEIWGAIGVLLERTKLLAEGAGAAPLAALLGQRIRCDGRRIVLTLSGGNIDLERLTSRFGKSSQEPADLPSAAV